MTSPFLTGISIALLVVFANDENIETTKFALLKPAYPFDVFAVAKNAK